MAAEEGTIGYRVGRGPDPGGPFELLAGRIAASGSGGSYEFLDPEPTAGGWYVVRELCADTACAVSPAVSVGRACGASGGRVRSRRR